MNEKTELHPNHLPDLRYVLKVLEGAHVPERQQGDVEAAITGMRYIIKRTEEAATSPSSKSTTERSDKLPEPPSFRTEWGGRVVAWGDALTYGHECFEAGRAALASSSIKEDGERAEGANHE